MTFLPTARVPGIVLVSLMLLSLSAIHPIIPVRAASSPTLFIAPTHQDLVSPGSTVTFGVNVSNISPSNPLFGWTIYVMTDPKVLNPTSMALGSFLAGASETTECINGSPTTLGYFCSGYDGPGIVHSEVTGSGSSGNGTLITISYNAVSGPYTFVTILSPMFLTVLNDVMGHNIAFTADDGNYGTLPSLPTASFNFYPKQPFSGDRVTFNATTSSAPPGHKLVDYLWTIAAATTTYLEGNITIASQVFEAGNWTVTLVVKDDRGISSPPLTRLVDVGVTPSIHLSVSGGVSVYPVDLILPGTIVSITVNVANFGTVPEIGFNVSIDVAGRGFKAPRYPNVLSPNQVTSFTFLWNTSGVAPDVYVVHGRVEPPVGQNNTADTDAFATVRIIYPFQGATIPLPLLQFLGLSFLSLILLGSIVALSRRIWNRKQLAKQEPL